MLITSSVDSCSTVVTYVTVKIIVDNQNSYRTVKRNYKIHVFSLKHTIYFPSYRKHPGVFKTKLIEETVLAEEKMMMFLKNLKKF